MSIQMVELEDEVAVGEAETTTVVRADVADPAEVEIVIIGTIVKAVNPVFEVTVGGGAEAEAVVVVIGIDHSETEEDPIETVVECALTGVVVEVLEEAAFTIITMKTELMATVICPQAQQPRLLPLQQLLICRHRHLYLRPPMETKEK